MATNKVIVTHAGALKTKYGSQGLSQIRAGLGAMVAADGERAITTRVVAIDSARDMAGFSKPTGTPATTREAKAAIDTIYAREQPDYIMILGAPDVIPLQSLSNPLYEPGGDDDDRSVPSDLPYACDAPYARDPNRFVGPTRVVGRLPDIVGANDPAYLLKLVRMATRAVVRAPDQYQQHFGLSAQIWQASSSLSLKNLFGSPAGMKTCPPSGPNWTAAQLAPRTHFINCHGSQRDPAYYGQPKGGREEYPEAHLARWLPGKISAATVLAAECCYGAELYNPQNTRGQAGIAYTYLGEGAYGVFGSTNIAYGPSSGNGSADLICQYFLHAVMQGASLGRAALEARQRFAQQYSHLAPEDLKTIAQFYLLGDPSIQPVAIPAHALNRTRAFKRAFAKTHDAGPRALRRERLRRVGRALERDLPVTRPIARKGRSRAPKAVRAALTSAARESGLKRYVEYHFAVTPKRGSALKNGKRRTIHMLMSSGRNPRESRGIRRVMLLVATAQNGKLVYIRRSHSR